MKHISIQLLMITFLTCGSLEVAGQKLLRVNTPTQKGQLTKKKKERVGVWRFYENGRLVLEYDYDVDRVIFQQTTDDKSYFYRDGERWIPVAQLEVYPRYKGSYLQFYETIYQYLRYPRRAQEHLVEGISFLSFEINGDGEAINPEIIHSIGYGCDQEMLKAYKKIKDQWIPGIKNGRPIHTRFVVPFVFSFFGSDYQLNIDDRLPPASLLDGVNITLYRDRLRQ